MKFYKKNSHPILLIYLSNKRYLSIYISQALSLQDPFYLSRYHEYGIDHGNKIIRNQMFEEEIGALTFFFMIWNSIFCRFDNNTWEWHDKMKWPCPTYRYAEPLPPPRPLSKTAVLIFWSKMKRNVLKRIEYQLSNFYLAIAVAVADPQKIRRPANAGLLY